MSRMICKSCSYWIARRIKYTATGVVQDGKYKLMENLLSLVCCHCLIIWYFQREEVLWKKDTHVSLVPYVVAFLHSITYGRREREM